MKKLIALVLMLVILTTSVMATRIHDEERDIEGFKVFKWVSAFASNKIVVHSINGGERGTIVIDIVREDLYEEALEAAKKLMKTEPTEYSKTHGTPYAISRLWI